MKQKSILITGVLGGIGSSIAKMFKENGYFVYGLDIRPEQVDFVDKLIVFDLNMYCSDYQYRDKFINYFDNNISALDVLVNNAAVQLLDRLDDLKLEHWQETLNVNLTGPLLLSQLFLTRLEQTQGCIINIGSIHQQLTKPRFISYATSKSALIGLTKALAVDLEGRVRVNAISPAAIQTDMLLAGFDGNEEALNQLRMLHPVQRIGYPNDVAKLVLFLASENSGFIHGANLSLDGGISSVLKDL
ncbi:short-chain dehydrogenase/reductase SDR [Emticicia oligotrophica DSM 17448]|uniref:Short-chain dehydrogenase/reductase SDR n=1 Tax=Emticicia oligotrophica (strain DSM 17448 / CIP 109782 / MTCC 6937 / GPTSA100-15) TaxID=929562 RepID=A0ABN4AU07_EMTOG|nr:SDR family oxidoreductase [Emticicia oligotrophica]AFK05421.1 short-chain dehydrogenase/reductase SDR [Emticicia oligotrophica DSM 17448]